MLFLNVARNIWAEFLIKNAADLNRLVYQGRDTLEPHLSEVEVPETLQLRIVKPSVQISPSLENPKISYMYVTWAKPKIKEFQMGLTYGPSGIQSPFLIGIIAG